MSILKKNWDLITKQVNKGEEVVIINFKNYIDKTDDHLNKELTYVKVVGKCDTISITGIAKVPEKNAKII